MCIGRRRKVEEQLFDVCAFLFKNGFAPLDAQRHDRRRELRMKLNGKDIRAIAKSLIFIMFRGA